MKNKDIHIRDPFVLVYNDRYYMYGTRGANFGQGTGGVDVYIGTDLENWEGPFEIFRPEVGFWADKNFWAAEVHYYKGKFYMLASFKAEV